MKMLYNELKIMATIVFVASQLISLMFGSYGYYEYRKWEVSPPGAEVEKRKFLY
jgi:hypothetical protein